MNNDKNAVKCDVTSCCHNDCNCGCNLKDVKISCTCDKQNACKSETICDSFEEKKENN